MKKKENPPADAVPVRRSSPSDACLILIMAYYDFDWGDVGQKHMLIPTGTTLGNTKGCAIELKKAVPAVKRQVTLYYDAEDQIWMARNDVRDRASRLYVNGLVSRLTVINNEDMIQLGKKGALFRFLQGAHVQESAYNMLSIRIEEEKSRADTDTLTQISNRQVLQRDLKQHIRDCRLYERNLSAIFLDIDHFHDVNTRYGHLGGDKVLSELAQRLQTHIRPLDTFARFGGEEFVVVLRDADYAQAMAFAERLRSMIADQAFVYGKQTIPITASLGVSTLEHTWKEEQLIRVANHCLHQAKDRGRNRVVGYKDLDVLPESLETQKKSPKKHKRKAID